MLPQNEHDDRLDPAPLHTADGRTRRAVLFSAVFVAMLVTLANHPQIHSHRFGLSGSNPHKVKVRLFMESKCPACKEFTAHYLNKIIQAPGVSQFQPAAEIQR